MLADKAFPEATWQQKFHAKLSLQEGRKLLKPQTYMNESGIAVRACCDFFQIETNELIVVHDDLEIPYGTIKLQMGGGLQGHNGLRSIKEHLNSAEFMRLRIGLGRPQRGNIASFVLSPFSKDEIPWLPSILTKAETLLQDSFISLPVTESVF